MIATLFYTGETALIAAPFDRFFVYRLKAAIPHYFRSWVPERKVWSVLTPYDRLAARYLLEYFPDAEIETPGAASPGIRKRVPQGCGCSPDHRLLGVCASASPELVRTTLRIAAKQHHPDAGGDVAVMQQLTAAADRILEGART